MRLGRSTRIERKNMKILAIGDVTSPGGIRHLSRNLWRFRERNEIDFCVVNGENASFITGISDELVEKLLLAGADVITGGNHTLQSRTIYSVLEEETQVLRPVNYGDAVPGNGYEYFDCHGYKVLVINAMGNVHIEPNLNSPFDCIEKVLRREAGRYDISILDIHAEATGEKLALAHWLDGKVNIIFGTHTHVPTADTQILPNGTGYVTDVGMCGESGGILGIDSSCVIHKMRTAIPIKYVPAEGPCYADGVIFDYDPTKRRVTSVKRVRF